MRIRRYRAGWQIWCRGAVSLLLAILLVMPNGLTSSVVADEGTPMSEETGVEPTAEVTVPSEEPIPVETELPTEEPVPTETQPPTPEPTERPINMDALAPDGDFNAITLQSDTVTSTNVSFTYQVTTPRQGTRIQAELRDISGGVAAGWVLSVPSAGASGAGSVGWTESSTLTMGTSFSVAFTIQAPAVTTAERVSLHVWSTALSDDGSEEAAVADVGALATIAVLPPTPTATPTEAVTPIAPATPVFVPATPVAREDGDFSAMSITNGSEIICTNAGADELPPGGSVTFSCTATPGSLVSQTYQLSIATSGWTVRINSGTAGATVTASLTGALIGGAVTFNATLIAPAGASLGASGSATVVRTTGGGTPSPTLLTATVSTITNSGGLLGYSLSCFGANPSSQSILPGGTLSFSCRMTGLAGIDLAGLTILGLSLTITAPAGWTITANGASSSSGSIVVSISTLANAALLTAGTFPISVAAPCSQAAGGPFNVNVTASLTLAGLGLVNFPSTVPVRVTTGTTNPPTVSVNNVPFGTSSWVGSSYQMKTTSLGLTVGPPSGCGMTSWKVQASASVMSSGGGSIPNSAITYTSTGNLGPGMSTGTSGALNASTTVLTGSAAVVSNTTVSVGLQIQPPANAPAGAYSGTITVTSSSGP